jgi:hypothetical protein
VVVKWLADRYLARRPSHSQSPRTPFTRTLHQYTSVLIILCTALPCVLHVPFLPIARPAQRLSIQLCLADGSPTSPSLPSTLLQPADCRESLYVLCTFLYTQSQPRRIFQGSFAGAVDALFGESLSQSSARVHRHETPRRPFFPSRRIPSTPDWSLRDSVSTIFNLDFCEFRPCRSLIRPFPTAEPVEELIIQRHPATSS